MLTEILELLKQNGEVDIYFKEKNHFIRIVNLENHLNICLERLNDQKDIIIDTSNFSLSRLLLSAIKDDPILVTSQGKMSSSYKEEDIYNEFYYLINSMLDNILIHHMNLLESEDIVDILSEAAKPYQKGIDKSYTFKEILIRLQFKLRATQLKYDCYQVDKHQMEEERKLKKNLL